MANLTYGTPEYYAEMFADILADVDATSERPYADNIIEGFYQALEDWFNYHDAQARVYADIHQRVRKTLAMPELRKQ
jgi:hypothetical protein